MNTAGNYVWHALERLRNGEGFDKVRCIVLYMDLSQKDRRKKRLTLISVYILRRNP